MSRTTFASPVKQGANGHQHASSSKNAGSFRSSLEQFRYANGNGNSKRDVAASDKSSDLSEPDSSDEERRRPKKRRLVRGGGTRSQSREPSVEEARPVKEDKKQPNGRPAIEEEDGDDSVQEIAPPPPRQSSTTPAFPVASTTSAPAASNGVPAPLSDHELRQKARVIIQSNPVFEPKRVIAALRQTRGDVAKATQLLTSRPSVVATKTFSLKSASNGIHKPAHATLASRPLQNGSSQAASNPSSRSSTPATMSRNPSQTMSSQPVQMKKQPARQS